MPGAHPKWRAPRGNAGILGGFLFLEQGLDVGGVEVAEVEAGAAAFGRKGDAVGDGAGGGVGVVLHGAHGEVGGKDDDEEAVLVDVHHEGAEIFALLIHAGEVVFIHELRHELHGVVSVGTEGGESGGVDRIRVATLVNEVTGLLHEQSDVCFALGEQFTHHAVYVIDIFLNKRWELAHINMSAS